jgi:hypothetical protein
LKYCTQSKTWTQDPPEKVPPSQNRPDRRHALATQQSILGIGRPGQGFLAASQDNQHRDLQEVQQFAMAPPMSTQVRRQHVVLQAPPPPAKIKHRRELMRAATAAKVTTSEDPSRGCAGYAEQNSQSFRSSSTLGALVESSMNQPCSSEASKNGQVRLGGSCCPPLLLTVSPWSVEVCLCSQSSATILGRHQRATHGFRTGRCRQTRWYRKPFGGKLRLLPFQSTHRFRPSPSHQTLRDVISLGIPIQTKEEEGQD